MARVVDHHVSAICKLGAAAHNGVDGASTSAKAAKAAKAARGMEMRLI